MNRTVTVDSADKSKIIIDGTETNLEQLNAAVLEVENQVTVLNDTLASRTIWLQELKDNVVSAVSQNAISLAEKLAAEKAAETEQTTEV